MTGTSLLTTVTAAVDKIAAPTPPASTSCRCTLGSFNARPLFTSATKAGTSTRPLKKSSATPLLTFLHSPCMRDRNSSSLSSPLLSTSMSWNISNTFDLVGGEMCFFGNAAFSLSKKSITARWSSTVSSVPLWLWSTSAKAASHWARNAAVRDTLPVIKSRTPIHPGPGRQGMAACERAVGGDDATRFTPSRIALATMHYSVVT
mmetsp:Transcript_31164/g.50050  ORF Transcript_31164/g.50050 Transcript_31164/m.50050 type:complete len:204 (-) Transcript_31164:22-633(-)|eukprot:CAMPEP_0198696718 /NCGR_PEP_ID=MMETSP1468-20131203/311688_1 /TAXON_ID=1461545 /ORGANISM="Mantoniella sp, Strain CCMP1436" /LENGTH=203 /DNA_ID=CAMNT_0044453113 /DNA_START=386 /DNA_END=997 /DNA_ORIENTATION=-